MKYFILLFTLVNAFTLFAQVTPPTPILPIPTARQLKWQQQELVMFVHFTVNTYTDKEWGDGTEDPNIFNPVELDAEQWARTAAECGFKTVILTAKHHDGFCLWPSAYTDHSVKSSPWKDGKGDVVRELANACRKYNINMGIYLSPWDRHETTYGQGEAYNQYYTAQLRELMSNYGELTEMWFDGANGEGPNGKVQVYDFDLFWSLVRQLQPGVCMFSDAGPDVRWIGNENGFAGETCWSMIDKSTVTIGKANTAYLNSGDPDGKDWVPGECDVSIRDGWFYHADQGPKSLDQLLDIYVKSVGRNSLLLLNVPPDRRGLFAEQDVTRLYEFRKALDSIFATNLAHDAVALASNTRGNSRQFFPDRIADGDPDTWWAADDTVREAYIDLDLGREREFNLVELCEPIAMGQRISRYDVQAKVNDDWHVICEGTTIGNKRLHTLAPHKARYIRITIHGARACPILSEFGLYHSKYVEFKL